MVSHSRARLGRVGRSTAALLALACVSDGPNGPERPPAPIATASELGALVGALAHDSLRGRRAGSPDLHVATEFVASQAAAYGLAPIAGSFFQEVPGEWRSVAAGSVTVNEESLTLWTDVVPLLPRTSGPVLAWNAQAIYGGTFTTTSNPLPAGVDVAGLAVVMDVDAGGPVLVSLAPESPLAGADVVVLVAPVPIEGALLALAQAKRLLAGAALRTALPAPVVLMVSRDVAERLMGGPLAGMQPGHRGGHTSGVIGMDAEPAAMRNVVALLPGSDAAVADEYVAVGAHLDHVGVRPGDDPTDSIYNGADDNASGSAALLMLARHFADPAHRPRRSLVFMWFDAEELGLFGSEAFSHAPTIPLGSISAFVNLDMLSRGGAADIPGGGPGYLQSIGSRRSSSHLGPIVDSVAGVHDLQLDYTFDAPGHPERVFCRSDHWNFARFGVPVVFFSTGVHAEYHTVDDEAERSDFDKLARVTTLVAGVVDAIASRPTQLTRDLPAPGATGVCEQ